MISARSLGVAALAMQCLAIGHGEFKELLDRLTPSTADHLQNYLIKHKARYNLIPSDQADKCLGGILLGVERALSDFPPYPPSPALTTQRVQDTIRFMDFALADEYGCPDYNAANDKVKFWIAKFTILSICDKLKSQPVIKERVSACFPELNNDTIFDDDDKSMSGDF